MPCLTLEIGALDTAHYGVLFYFFSFACYLSSSLLKVDPFDQPGVEAYKVKWRSVSLLGSWMEQFPPCI